MYADRVKQWYRRSAGLPVMVRGLRRQGQAGFRLLLPVLLLLPGVAMAVPAGTIIDNTAMATFGGGITTRSNTVTTVTVIARTPATIEFLRHAPLSPTAQPVVVNVTGYSTSGTPAGPFAPMAAPVPSGSTVPLDLSAPVPLDIATMYHQGDPVFVRLTDLDQNEDALLAETVLVTVGSNVTGDSELLQLTETGPNTGVFTGYIQSYLGIGNPGAATPANGQFGLQDDDVVTADYVDVADATDTATVSTLVDPFGLVFDSSTGALVDGAQITLVDAASGLPAMVYGDDGISTFPSTITSGGSATDSSGRVYSFGTGEYRFPFVMPGTYILQVSAPPGYSVPSVVPAFILQALPGAPFAIDDQGSRGLPFAVPVGPAIQVDIPLDPDAPGFFLVKEVNKRVAAAGDFLQYRLNLTNGAGVVAAGTQVVDTLPPGLRYQPGSTTVDGTSVADPAIDADGRTLTFDLDDIADGVVTELRYVVEVTAGIRGGEAVNRAVASAGGGTLVSNQGTAVVRIREEFLRARNVLMGRVIADGCDAADQAQGVAGVRIYLENGTYVVSDERGMFHFEGVRAGSHVVQMDLETLGPHFEPVICDEHSRFAGRAWSRFVDLQGGTLWRTDFHVKALPPPVAEVQLAVDSSVDDHVVTWHLALQGGDVPLENMRLMVNLPETTAYLPGSSVLDNSAIADPEVRGQVLIYDLGEVDGAWNKQLNFLAEAEVKGETSLLPGKAFLLFDSPGRRAQRTPVVETVVKRVRHDRFFQDEDGSHFDTFVARLSRQDRRALERIADELRAHKVLRIEATGHTDNVPIRARSRGTFADNFALSIARARSVAEYLA
ncbi:MAG: OmpA family protein, partial [Thiohalobacterales bacterium]|nr:OmpA family protein [Thiohalobacterales bacterium]